MRRWVFASLGVVLAIAGAIGMAGCFSDDNGGGIDAAFPNLDSSVLDAPVLPDTTTRDSTIDTGVDAPLDSTVEASPEAAPDTGVESGPEAAAEAAVEAGDDATMEAAVPDVAVEAAGCTKATDCPANFACDTSTGQCVQTCGAATDTPCNGGCCDTGRCAAGAANGACGLDGNACAVCANGTPTCAGGTCTATCDPMTAPCGAGSCCAASKVCQPQTAPTTCGTGCVDCTGNAAGAGCALLANGAYGCGCNVASDCPANQACDTATHACVSQCGANQTACNGGCCDARSGLCVPGTNNGFCGSDGLACSACANGTPTCSAVAGGGNCSAACGAAGDGTCGTGLCCASTATCQTQNTPTACGTACTDCTAGQLGSQCLNGGANGYFCGCTVPTDCPVGYACNIRSNTCATTCLPGTFICNGGCCQTIAGAGSTCVTGTANNACGADGKGCTDCTPNALVCQPATQTCGP